MERKAISKKDRFEVFKRDDFSCQYCNSKPPNVALEIDHIHPVSKGGDNSIDNLITACFDCNRGKSNKELNSIPERLLNKTENIKIANDQYKQYQKEIKKKKAIIEKQINVIENMFISFYPKYTFTERFKITVKQFINKLDEFIVLESMESACLKFETRNGSVQDVTKYFCGICWNKIRENE